MNTLKKLIFLIFAGIICLNSQASELISKLENLPNVISVKKLETNKSFSEKYLIVFEQYLDSSIPEAGTFQQRVYLSHKSYNAPVVFITEGYSADYAESKNYVNELTRILDANQICVEHRFFSESTPEEKEWSYLTTSLAASDHHNIRTAFDEIYKSKWVSTGISKGGQTALLYQMYYPNDVDVTVAYVAPVATALEDGRHEPFINNIGTKKDRKRITKFQIEVLSRRETLLPMMEQYITISKLNFRLPIEEVFEYCVLEYSFAFWQWVGDSDKIPSKKEADDKIFQHLIAVSGPEYFSIEGAEPILPFFYQAAKELGYYGYETETLAEHLKIGTAEGYFNKLFLSKEMRVDFYTQTSKDLHSFLNEKAKRTIMIYGEYDPWTAAAPNVSANQEIIKVVKPGGTHATRIMNLPEEDKNMVLSTLKGWME